MLKVFTEAFLNVGNGLYGNYTNSREMYLNPELCQKLPGMNLFQKLSRTFNKTITTMDGFEREQYCLSPKNENLCRIYKITQNKIPGASKTYLCIVSIDTVVDANNAVKPPAEHLNSLEVTGGRTSS